MLPASSADLNTATDAQIVNVEDVSASSATTGVTIDLRNQSEGFTITGSGLDDVVRGGSGADNITAGGGNDTINGFVGADTANGGAGTDTITLSGTSADLNAASNSQVINIEAISAASANIGVTIDLHNQTEAFTVTGSALADTVIATASNDTIVGFIGADNVNGGAGTDKIAISTTSLDLNTAMDAQVLNVEAVNASSATVGVTIDLHNQSEGFTITGSGLDDVIAGGTGTDNINGGTGNDVINGFVGADTVNGGAGTDTIALSGTSADLNVASNSQITNIEAVSAASANASVTIDLHNQGDGFAITGSTFADTIIGSTGRTQLWAFPAPTASMAERGLTASYCQRVLLI